MIGKQQFSPPPPTPLFSCEQDSDCFLRGSEPWMLGDKSCLTTSQTYAILPSRIDCPAPVTRRCLPRQTETHTWQRDRDTQHTRNWDSLDSRGQLHPHTQARVNASMFLTNWHGYLQGKSVCDQANVQKIDSMQIGEIIISPPLCPDRMPRIPNVALERITLPKTNPFFFLPSVPYLDSSFSLWNICCWSSRDALCCFLRFRHGLVLLGYPRPLGSI